MRFFIVALVIVSVALNVNAQGVGINSSGTAPSSGAMLDVASNSKGVLFPRMTLAQRNLISGGSPATGMLIYQTDNNPGFYYFDGVSWMALLSAQNISGTTPVGSVNAYGGSIAPSGWLLCDGSAVSRTTYADLFAIVGTTYGAGNGSTTFNLPDLRGRNIIGAGSGPGLTTRSLNGSGGEETHQLTINQMPAHTHHAVANVNISIDTWSATNKHLADETSAGGDTEYDLGGTSATPNVGETSSQGGGQAHNVMDPFRVLNYIIYTGN